MLVRFGPIRYGTQYADMLGRRVFLFCACLVGEEERIEKKGRKHTCSCEYADAIWFKNEVTHKQLERNMKNLMTMSIKSTEPGGNIRLDGDTQARVALDPAVVENYAELMKSGTKFPPVTVYFDGNLFWLADGFHRVYAAQKADLKKISVEIVNGSPRDAKLFALSANATHGLNRSNEDKRKAVVCLLTDDEWRKWSSRKIARHCGVSDPFVGSIRKELSANRSQMERVVERNGTTYSMNTKDIGSVKKPASGDATLVAEALSDQRSEVKQNAITGVSSNIEFNSASDIQRDEIIGPDIPQREVAKNFDQNAGSWKERLLGFPWASVNGEPLPTKIGFAVMITMEEVPGSTDLLAILEVARKAQYGLFATTDVQQHLVNTATKEFCLLDNKVVAAPTVEKATRRKRLPRFDSYEQPF